MSILLDKLEAIEARLESIEKMLSAESKPDKTITPCQSLPLCYY